MMIEKTIGNIRYIFVKDKLNLFVRSGVMKAKDFSKNMESFLEELNK